MGKDRQFGAAKKEAVGPHYALSLEDPNDIDDNEEAFKNLVHAVRAGAYPVIGAGTSTPAGYPSWPAAVTMLAEQIKQQFPTLVSNVHEITASSDSYSVKAEHLRSMVDTTFFAGFINSAFTGNDHRHTECHAALLNVPFQHILTTNYDCLIERAADASRIPHVSLVLSTPESAARVVDSLDRRDVCNIVHLHGRSDDPSSIIFTDKEYRRFYDQGAWATAALKHFASGHLVFIGCSLTDSSILEPLRSFARILEGAHPRHFALVSGRAHATQYRRMLQRDFRIQPVYFDSRSRDYRALTIVLTYLNHCLRRSTELEIATFFDSGRTSARQLRADLMASPPRAHKMPERLLNTLSMGTSIAARLTASAVVRKGIVRPCTHIELETVVPWIFVEGGRLFAGGALEVHAAIELAHQRLGIDVNGYLQLKRGWAECNEWAATTLVGDNNVPRGVAFAFPVTEAAFREVARGERPLYACSKADYSIGSGFLLIDGLAMRPSDNTLAAAREPGLGLVRAMICQVAYLGLGSKVGIEKPLLILTASAAELYASELKVHGYRNLGVTMKNTSLDLFEKRFTLVEKMSRTDRVAFWALRQIQRTITHLVETKRRDGH